MRLVVAALGGNALLRRGQRPDARSQRANIRTAARSPAVIARDHDLVVTHGNGPQVGLLALQALAYDAVTPYPLDVLVAESEGMIGYVIEQELANQLPERNVATLLTQVVVDRDDPAFASPAKPIGPIYDEAEAKRLATQYGWHVAPDEGGFRRVVPSPKPRRILEIETIRLLVASGAVVVCAGGGGVPVVINPGGAVQGVEAVVDKDHAAALLAVELDADEFLIVTDVPCVYTGWATKRQSPIHRATPRQLAEHAFSPGSMGPKVEAACTFVDATGRRTAIGALEDTAEMLAGHAGTIVEPDASRPRPGRYVRGLPEPR